MAPASILFDIGWQPTLVTSSAFLIVSVLMTCLNKTLQAFILEFLKFGGGKQFTGDLEKLVENQYKKASKHPLHNGEVETTVSDYLLRIRMNVIR